MFKSKLFIWFSLIDVTIIKNYLSVKLKINIIFYKDKII